MALRARIWTLASLCVSFAPFAVTNSVSSSWSKQMNRLDGKVALISGAARGIGGETARLMVEAGARVAIGDVLDEPGRETARALGDNALYVHLDVTSEQDWNDAVAAATGRFGKLDILVNNAGLFLGKDIESVTPGRMGALERRQPDRRLSRHQAVPAGIARGGPATARTAARSSISPRPPVLSARRRTRSIR